MERNPETRTTLARPRVVLVHDWLTGMRGGEKVLESLCRLFPDADLLTLVHTRGSVSALIERRRIRPSFVQRLPWPGRLYRHYLPGFPAAIEQFDLDEVDVVLSTSHCAAKAVVPNGRAVHVCYCHSPMRYGWDQFDEYFGKTRAGGLAHLAARHVMAPIARWDRDTAPRVHRFLANSQHVAGRIGRYYNRRATVLYPPVDTQFFTPGEDRPRQYFLVVSALVPYKKIDTAIRAAAKLGVPLQIVGTGPDRARLQALAGQDVTFLGHVGQPQLRDLYRGARALVLPGEEDFGIAPVEALACGSRVVALGRGGACETVEHGVTGWLVPADSNDPAGAFASAMAKVDGLLPGPADGHRQTAAFGVERFERQFVQRLAETLQSPNTW